MNEQNDKVFDLYKPLRNKIRKHNLNEALYMVWSYSRNYTFNHPFAQDIELPTGFSPTADMFNRRYKGLQEFELEFLTREFILHCHSNRDNKSILKHANLRKIINYLRSTFDNGLHKLFDKGNILLDSHRWSHRQFKWQIGDDQTDMLRYHKIFSASKVDELIKKNTGLTVSEIHMLGFYLYSISSKSFKHSYPIISTSNAISQKMLDTFFSIFAMSIEEARTIMKSTYRMDETILYSFNPLTAKPILIMDDTFICPLHRLLFWQITNGLYYFIVKEPKFKAAFGDSFEAYIGEVIEDTRDKVNSELFKESIYGSPEKKTSDWILTDQSSIVFVECKSKRMTLASKSELEVEKGLENDIEKMSAFVVQIYKTYLDYKSNKYSEIRFDEKLLFVPIVVTLEPWFTNYNVVLPEMIKELVRNKLIEAKIDLDILNDHPFHIRSCEEFESDMQIIAKIGGRKYAELHSNNEFSEFEKQFEYEYLFEGQFEKTFIDPVKALED